MPEEKFHSIFRYHRILEAAKEHFKTIDVNDIDSTSILNWLLDLGLEKFIEYRLVETLMFRLRDDLWRWKEVKKMPEEEEETEEEEEEESEED